MKTLLSLFIFLCLSAALKAQSTQTKYFKDEFLSKEVSSEKAKFVQTITNNEDGSVTKEVKDLKADKVIRRESKKGKEPVGIWLKVENNKLLQYDFDFALEYTDLPCPANALLGKQSNYLSNNDSIGYKAPLLENGEVSLMRYLVEQVRMPDCLVYDGIQGKVFVQFTVSKTGKVEQVQVTKGVHPELDKETVRLFRELKFSSPATLNGTPIAICVNMPMNYKLQ